MKKITRLPNLPGDVARCKQEACKTRLDCLRYLCRNDRNAGQFILPPAKPVGNGRCRFMLEEVA